jgi:hypothetical protein
MTASRLSRQLISFRTSRGSACSARPIRAARSGIRKKGPRLDRIENDLLRLCGVHGNGWAAYVQRLDTPGIREYYVYFGDGAAMDNVLPELKAAHPDYRLEYDRVDDLRWAQYRKWLGWIEMKRNDVR